MADPSSIADQIIVGVVPDTKFWVAAIGLIGAVVGSLLTMLGNFAFHWFQTRNEQALRRTRKDLLEKLLKAKSWRRVSTMSKVIGSTEEETKALLLECGARGSEKHRDDGEELWGLISVHPLKDVQEADE